MIDILLIEDDIDYAKSFVKHMNEQDLIVSHISVLDEKDILEEISKSPKVIVLDFFFGNNTSLNTYLFLKKFNIPVLYLTSNNSLDDESMMLKYGVNDYVDKLKPMDIIYQKISNNIKVVKKELEFFSNVLDIENKKLNDTISLTNNEYSILLLLVKNIGNYVDKKEIMIELYNDNEFAQTNTISVAIKRLREKIKKNNLNVVIGLEKNKGYYIYEI